MLIVVKILTECEIDIRTLTGHQVFSIRKDGRGGGLLALEKTAGGWGKYSFTGLLGQKIQCTQYRKQIHADYFSTF